MIKGKRLISVILALVLLFGAIPFVQGVTAEAASKTKIKKSYDIAIAFDNSGSMYEGMLWSQAKYATEIFASMLDYESGDKLTIFTMWEVTTDGKAKTGGSTKFDITCKDDINKITNMYTVEPKGTPFAPVEEAYDYLANSEADEKWLIIMTDGAFDRRTRNELKYTDGFNTKSYILGGKAKDKNGNDITLNGLKQDYIDRKKTTSDPNVKIQYLGFGSADTLDSDEKQNFYAETASDGEDVKTKLIAICNRIFKRNELPADKLKFNKSTKVNELTLDLSMSKVIVFVQGKDAEISSLTYIDPNDDEKNKKIGVISDSEQRSYSKISAGKYLNSDYPTLAKPDESLAGQVVIFDACEKGKYILDYTDGAKIQIFYEPDVEMKVTLMSSENEKVDPTSGKIPAGDYVITSQIVDAVTGEDVTDHELLGKNVAIVTKVKRSGDSDPQEYGNGAKISLAPDEKTEVVIEGTYLDDYKITTEDDPSAFPLPLLVLEPSGTLSISVTDPNDSYKLNEADEWKPLKVELYMDGNPLDDTQMKSVKLTVDGGELITGYKSKDKNAFEVYIGKSNSSQKVSAESGDFAVEITAEYTDALGEVQKDTKKHKIKIDSTNFNIKLENQHKDKYILSDADKWGPIKVTPSIDGAPLSPTQMNKVSLELDDTTKIPCQIKKDTDECVFYVYPGKDENGKTVKVIAKDYNIKLNASYVDGTGNTSTDSKTELINIQSAVFDVSIKNEQPDATYNLSDVDSWKPIKLSVSLNKKTMSDEELASVDIIFDEENSIAAYTEPIKGGSAFYVYVARKEDGSFVEPPVGNQILKADVIYTDALGNENRQSISLELEFKYDFAATAVLEEDWYVIAKKDEWEPIRVDLLLEGKPLSDDQLENVKIELDLNRDIKYTVEPIYGESAMRIDLGWENGTFEAPECAKYKGNVKASYTNAQGKTITSSDDVKFTVKLYSKWVIYVSILAIILLLLIIWLLFMNQKVLPKKIDKAPGASDIQYFGNPYGENFVIVEYRKKSKNLRISTRGVDGMSCAATFKLKAVDNRFTASKQRRIGIIGINSNCDTIMINGIEYVKAKGGTWVKSTFLDIAGENAKIPPMDYSGRNPMFELSRQGMIVSTRIQNIK